MIGGYKNMKGYKKCTNLGGLGHSMSLAKVISR